MRGLFVTGTDTGIGKTVVSAAAVMALRAATPAGYWKPVQTGIEQDDDTRDVRRLAACAPAEIWDHGVRLPRPLSPHLSAHLAGTRVDVAGVVAAAPAEDRCWVVEGAGGVLVPLNDREDMTDLMRALALPVLVAARSTLGTINHTRLTVEALRGRSLHVAGIVLVGPPNDDNREAVETRTGTRVLGVLPPLDSLTHDALAAWAAGPFAAALVREVV